MRGTSGGAKRAGLAVEPATPDDVPEIADLAMRVLEEAWSERGFAGQAAKRGAFMWTARSGQGGELLGFLVGERVLDELHVLSVGVAPECRRRGVGRALVARALEAASSAGVDVVHLELRASNRAARSLYQGFGFVEVGRRQGYYGRHRRHRGPRRRAASGAEVAEVFVEADAASGPSAREDAVLMTRDTTLDTTLDTNSDTNPDTPLHSQLHPPLRARAEILTNRCEGGANWRLVLDVPGWPGSRPGQFLMLSPGALSGVARTDPLLPRPMAIYRERPRGAGAEVDVLYKVSGRGTSLLAEAEPGQALGVVGPLGQGFGEPARGARSILVGGGTGVASLYGLAAAGLAAGSSVSVLLGARSAGDLMAGADFSELGVDLRVATEDGSEGKRGLVTELLEELLASQVALQVDAEADTAPPTLYVCGPTPMMRRCAEIAEARSVPCVVSLENRMACGFGVCLGCAVPVTAGGYGLVCREGPVFRAGDVAWEGLP